VFTVTLPALDPKLSETPPATRGELSDGAGVFNRRDVG
jgi:hypothetical protein